MTHIYVCFPPQVLVRVAKAKFLGSPQAEAAAEAALALITRHDNENQQQALAAAASSSEGGDMLTDKGAVGEVKDAADVSKSFVVPPKTVAQALELLVALMKAKLTIDAEANEEQWRAVSWMMDWCLHVCRLVGVSCW